MSADEGESFGRARTRAKLRGGGRGSCRGVSMCVCVCVNGVNNDWGGAEEGGKGGEEYREGWWCWTEGKARKRDRGIGR